MRLRGVVLGQGFVQPFSPVVVGVSLVLGLPLSLLHPRCVPKVAPKVTKEEFYEEISGQDVNRIHSKLGATTLVFMLANSTQKASDGFVSYIINYAGSKLEESSVYLKVYE